MTMRNDIEDIIYLIELVTKDEKLTSVELEHLSDMLIRLGNEFSQST